MWRKAEKGRLQPEWDRAERGWFIEVVLGLLLRQGAGGAGESRQQIQERGAHCEFCFWNKWKGAWLLIGSGLPPPVTGKMRGKMSIQEMWDATSLATTFSGCARKVRCKPWWLHSKSVWLMDTCTFLQELEEGGRPEPGRNSSHRGQHINGVYLLKRVKQNWLACFHSGFLTSRILSLSL